jgi:hypothetical protein
MRGLALIGPHGPYFNFEKSFEFRKGYPESKTAIPQCETAAFARPLCRGDEASAQQINEKDAQPALT